jgi:hypothetical protein
MGSSLKDLERRRERTIRRIANERGTLLMLATDVARPAHGVLRWRNRIRRGWRVATSLAGVAMPVASVLFRSHPLVKRTAQVLTVWQVVKGLVKKRAADASPDATG